MLKNVSNLLVANPAQEMQRLHNQIKSEADKIKQNGDLTQLAKVEKELAKMQKGSILVNVSRRGLIDEDALVKALESGHLDGAGLDVF